MADKLMTFVSITPDPVAFVVNNYVMISDETYGFPSNDIARLSAKEADSRYKAYGPHMSNYRPFGFWRLKERKEATHG